MMRCPVCCKPMIVVEWERVELDYCAHGDGLWFDAGELQLLFEAQELSLGEVDFKALCPVKQLAPTGQSASSKQAVDPVDCTEAERHCPHCKDVMEKIRLGPEGLAESDKILLDRCPQGEGLWFDRQELAHLMSLYRNSVELEQEQPSAQILAYVGRAVHPSTGDSTVE